MNQEQRISAEQLGASTSAGAWGLRYPGLVMSKGGKNEVKEFTGMWRLKPDADLVRGSMKTFMRTVLVGLALVGSGCMLFVAKETPYLNAAQDHLGNFAKFTPVTVANGKVYAATFSNRLAVYGLRPLTDPRPTPGAPALAPARLRSRASRCVRSP